MNPVQDLPRVPTRRRRVHHRENPVPIRSAHEPMRRSSSGLRALIEFRPGHMKYDYAYSIEERRPDLVVQLWQHPKDVQPYLAKYYKAIRLEGWCIYVRQGSANILWDKLPSETCQ